MRRKFSDQKFVEIFVEEKGFYSGVGSGLSVRGSGIHFSSLRFPGIGCSALELRNFGRMNMTRIRFAHKVRFQLILSIMTADVQMRVFSYLIHVNFQCGQLCCSATFFDSKAARINLLQPYPCFILGTTALNLWEDFPTITDRSSQVS